MNLDPHPVNPVHYTANRGAEFCALWSPRTCGSAYLTEGARRRTLTSHVSDFASVDGEVFLELTPRASVLGVRSYHIHKFAKCACRRLP